MDCKNNEDKIISYLENDLDANEREKFEIELESNSSLKSELIEMKELLNSLDSLPKVKAKDDFIVSLNEKIDLYDTNTNKNWKSIFGNFFSLGTISSNGSLSSKISAVAISTICIFCIMIYSEMYNTNQVTSLSNSSSIDMESESVANVDSLNLDSVDR